MRTFSSQFDGLVYNYTRCQQHRPIHCVTKQNANIYNSNCIFYHVFLRSIFTFNLSNHRFFLDNHQNKRESAHKREISNQEMLKTETTRSQVSETKFNTNEFQFFTLAC